MSVDDLDDTAAQAQPHSPPIDCYELAEAGYKSLLLRRKWEIAVSRMSKQGGSG